MKKIIALTLILALSLVCLVACGASEAEYKLGMGISVSLAKSKTGAIEADSDIAAVVLDKDGKIVACKIDFAQNKVAITDGQLPESVTFQTKAEKGDAYGMKAISGIQKEWWEQANFLAEYLVGKTVADVKAIALEGGYATDADLLAGCTIAINGALDAVVKACEDIYAKSFTAGDNFTLGLGVTSALSKPKSATADADGSVSIATDFAATVTAADGKVLAAIVDIVEPKFTFNAAGEVTSDTAAAVASKREKHDAYGMKAISGIQKEWWEQADHFTSIMVGKTAAEIATLSSAEADATMTAGCTIATAGFYSALNVALNGYGK